MTAPLYGRVRPGPPRQLANRGYVIKRVRHCRAPTSPLSSPPGRVELIFCSCVRLVSPPAPGVPPPLAAAVAAKLESERKSLSAAGALTKRTSQTVETQA